MMMNFLPGQSQPDKRSKLLTINPKNYQITIKMSMDTQQQLQATQIKQPATLKAAQTSPAPAH